jgi:putative ABC transport system permease protein
MLHSIAQDVRHSLRGIARRPAFAATVIATLTLGIGANAAIFSVVNGVLLRPLAYAEPDRIVQVRHQEPYISVSEPEFLDYRRELGAFERVAAYTQRNATLTGVDEPERIAVAPVSDGFFAVLGVRALLGRTFLPPEDVRGAPRVVVLSEGLWRRRFGADPRLVGHEVRLEGEPVTVVGIMPDAFRFPNTDVAAWVPLRLNEAHPWTRNNHYLQLVGRLAPGATLAGATTQMAALGARWARDYPDTYFPGKPLLPMTNLIRDEVLGHARPYLLTLFGAVGFVLLIACVNVANLLLARGESRRKELALRVALGASRGRLARAALTDSAVYALVGGALGLALAWGLTHALVALAPEDIPRLDQVRLDPRVVVFTLGLSLVTGVLFGLAPALRGAREGWTHDTLKEGGRTASPARGFTRARSALVVAEVALAVVMLSGAGLMLRSLLALQAIDLGFRADHVLTAGVDLPTKEYDSDRAVTFYETLLARVRTVPGVRAAGAVGDLPVAGGFSIWSILIDGMGMRSVADAPSAMPQQVTPDYFAAMRIPLVRGRTFAATDREGAPLVAVVNETMARTLWPKRDPIGGTIRMLNDSAPPATVVGIVKDVRSSGFQGEVPPTMYFPHAQAKSSAYYAPTSMSLVVRTDGDPLAVAGAVRAAVRALDRNVPVRRVRSMEQVLAGSVASRRFSTGLLAGFAALALVLAGIGIYGVISYAVSQRTFEIGVRVALGAPRWSVLGLMLGEGMRLALVGLAIGLALALCTARLIGSLLVGVSALDVPTMAGVVLALGGVALVASYVPARRAARVDPVGAMRGE